MSVLCFVFATQLCRLACFTRCLTAHAGIFFSRRRVLLKRMDERETDSLGLSRQLFQSLKRGSTRFLVLVRITVPVARPMCACLSFPGLFLPDQFCRPVRFTCRSSSHISPNCRHASQIGFLAHKVFAASLSVYPVCLEDARMFGKKLSRKKTREVGNVSIYQDLEHQRYQRCSGRGKLRRRIWGFSATNDAYGVFQSRYLLHE